MDGLEKLSTEVADSVRALAEEILLDTAFSLDRPVSHEGLSFIPIVQNETEEQEIEYINAALAIEQGVLELTEMGDAVNTIMAHNKGTIAVLIEEAEVLSAQGSQDRMVVSSVLLKPGEQRRIPVKCVHAPHGLRRGSAMRTIGSASYGLRSEMRSQKYRSIMTDVDHYIPETAVDQSEIWERVKSYCAVAGSADPDKYTEALEVLRKKAEEDAKQVMDSIPERTSGVIVFDAEGELLSFEMYRSHQAFWKRSGFIESIMIDFGKKDSRTLEDEVVFAKAVQLLMNLKNITPEEVIAQDGSDNLQIGTPEIKGEAITSVKGKLRRILYCSFGK
jgi:hypothetical protein